MHSLTARDDGAAPVIDVMALVEDQHAQTGAAVDQLIAGEHTGLAAAEDGDVVSLPHGIVSLS